MHSYIETLKIILKNFDGQCDDIIKNILIKIFDIYYLDRDIQTYNIDNVFQKYNMNMYDLLERKYILTKSKKLTFKKHKYDKREYIMFLLKKNNIDLNEDESYKSIVDEILKNDINCCTKYINNYCKNRIVDNIKNKKYDFKKNPYKNKNLYIVYIMSNEKICNNKITKLNQYFYMTSEGEILKYKKYCIINNYKKLSYNYSGKKELLYCNDHKLDKMVNIKKGYSFCDKHNISYLKFCKECEQSHCLLCDETVYKNHYFSKKHIDNFDKNITIKTRTSIKKKFIDMIIDFHVIDKDVFYKDLYFKDKVKSLISKHRKKDKEYKISIYKYNQSVKDNLNNFWIEKFDIDNLSEIDNIDKLILKNFKNLKCFDFDNLYGRNREGFDGTVVDQEQINIISEGDIEYDASQMKIIQNTRLLIKTSECNIFSAGNSLEINKIPEIFFQKRNLVIIKNLNDNKCLLWCFIRKHLNPIITKSSRFTKKDIEISKELIDEHNFDFEDVSLDEIDSIENFLECNIHIFGCNKYLASKKILRKSLKNHSKDLDLLLIDGINHYILIKNINLFIGNNSHIVKSCRNCLNSFYSEEKYIFHIEFCMNRKPKNYYLVLKNTCILKI